MRTAVAVVASFLVVGVYGQGLVSRVTAYTGQCLEGVVFETTSLGSLTSGRTTGTVAGFLEVDPETEYISGVQQFDDDGTFSCAQELGGGISITKADIASGAEQTVEFKGSRSSASEITLTAVESWPCQIYGLADNDNGDGVVDATFVDCDGSVPTAVPTPAPTPLEDIPVPGPPPTTDGGKKKKKSSSDSTDVIIAIVIVVAVVVVIAVAAGVYYTTRKQRSKTYEPSMIETSVMETKQQSEEQSML